MKALLVKCGICYEFFSPKVRHHCAYCGAMKVGRKHYNEKGIEMARGVPYVYTPPTNCLYEDYEDALEMEKAVNVNRVQHTRPRISIKKLILDFVQ